MRPRNASPQQSRLKPLPQKRGGPQSRIPDEIREQAPTKAPDCIRATVLIAGRGSGFSRDCHQTGNRFAAKAAPTETVAGRNRVDRMKSGACPLCNQQLAGCTRPTSPVGRVKPAGWEPGGRNYENHQRPISWTKNQRTIQKPGLNPEIWTAASLATPILKHTLKPETLAAEASRPIDQSRNAAWHDSGSISGKGALPHPRLPDKTASSR